MPPAAASIVIWNLESLNPYLAAFEVECWNSGRTTKIAGPLTSLGTWDPASGKWKQRDPIYFRGLTLGATYSFRARIIPQGGGSASSWSAWADETAGDTTAPATTYSPNVVASIGGIIINAVPSGGPTDHDHYEWYFKINDTNPPAATDIPNLSARDSIETIVLATAQVASIYIRAVDTSGNRQAWTSLGGFNSNGVNVFLMNVNDLDDIDDGASYLRSPQRLGGSIVVENANFEASSTLPPPGWTTSSATLSYETATHYSGTRSLKVVASQQYGAALSVRRWAVRPGEKYKVSARAKTEAGKAAGCQLMLLDGNGTYVFGIQSATTSASWVLIEASGTVPAGAVQALLSLQINDVGGGTGYFDEIFVSRLRNLDDEVDDGATYARPRAAVLSDGRVRFLRRSDAVDVDVDNAFRKNVETLDNVLEGSTYGRPLATRLNAGKPLIDFAETIHSNKNADYIAEAATRKWAAESGADVTGAHSSADTAAVSGLAAARVPEVISSVSGVGVLKSSKFNGAHLGLQVVGAAILTGLEISTTGWRVIDTDTLDVPDDRPSLTFTLAVGTTGVGSVALAGGNNVGISIGTESSPGTPEFSRAGNGNISYTNPPAGSQTIKLYVNCAAGAVRVTGTATKTQKTSVIA